uniref:Uncharacterized protein n=1 Tax=Anguilla anguilla TaxID=7936 RepID=A0A0E9P6H6_ANGAN
MYVFNWPRQSFCVLIFLGGSYRSR